MQFGVFASVELFLHRLEVLSSVELTAVAYLIFIAHGKLRLPRLLPSVRQLAVHFKKLLVKHSGVAFLVRLLLERSFSTVDDKVPYLPTGLEDVSPLLLRSHLFNKYFL